jgi:hypothetical protein
LGMAQSEFQLGLIYLTLGLNKPVLLYNKTLGLSGVRFWIVDLPSKQSQVIELKFV